MSENPENSPAAKPSRSPETPARIERTETRVPAQELADLAESMKDNHGFAQEVERTRAETGTHEPWKQSIRRLEENPDANVFEERWGSRQEVNQRYEDAMKKVRASKVQRTESEGFEAYELTQPEGGLSLNEYYDDVLNGADRLKAYEFMERMKTEQDPEILVDLRVRTVELQERISERQLMSGLMSRYVSSMEFYAKLKSDVAGRFRGLGERTAFPFPDESVAIQHHAYFRRSVENRLAIGVEYMRHIDAMNEVKRQYALAKESPDRNPQRIAELRTQFEEMNGRYDEIKTRSETYEADLLNIIQCKAGPGKNETGLLPIQGLTLKVIDTEYGLINQAYADYERLGSTETGRNSEEFRSRASLFASLKNRGMLNAQAKTDALTSIGRFDVYRTRIAMIRNTRSSVPLPGGKPIEELSRDELAQYRDDVLKENASASIGNLESHLNAMEEAVPPVTTEIGDQNAFIDDMAARLRKLETGYSITGVGPLDRALQAYNGDPRQAMFDALNWPRNENGTPKTVEQMNETEKTWLDELKNKTGRMSVIVEDFRSSDSISDTRESLAVCKVLLNPEWKIEDFAQDVDYRNFPPPGTRVTPQTMDQLAQTYGKKVVMLLAMQQLSIDWERYGAEYEQLMKGMHECLGLQYEVAASEEVFRAKNHEVEETIKSVTMIATAVPVYATLRYGNALLRGRFLTKAAADWQAVNKLPGAAASRAGALGRGMYRLGERGLDLIRPGGRPLVAARVLGESRIVTDALGKLGTQEAELLAGILKNPAALSTLDATRLSSLPETIRAAKLTQQEAYALQRAIQTASREAGAGTKLASVETALFKVSGGVAREIGMLSASAKVLGGAALAFQAYMVYDAFDQWNDAAERADQTKQELQSQLDGCGFTVQYRNGRPVYVHPDMPGVEIDIDAINKGLSAEEQARMLDAITATGGLISVLAITTLATGGAAVVLLIGAVVVEIVIHAVIEHYEFESQKELLAGDRALPPWLLLALGTVKSVNKTPGTVLDQLDVREDLDEALAERMIWLQWVEELQSASPTLYAEVFCDKQSPAEVDAFFNEQWHPHLFGMWQNILRANISPRIDAANAAGRRLNGRNRPPVKDISDLKGLLSHAKPMERRQAMRDSMAAYMPYMRAKRYADAKERLSESPYDMVRLGEEGLHMETVVELFGEQEILGRKMKDFTAEELAQITADPSSVLEGFGREQLYSFINDPVQRMQLLDLYERDSSGSEFKSVADRSDVRYAVNSLVSESGNVPDFGKGMSILGWAQACEAAGCVYDDDSVRLAQQRLTEKAALVAGTNGVRDDALARRLFGSESSAFDASAFPLVTAGIDSDREMTVTRGGQKEHDRGPSGEIARKWCLDVARQMLEEAGAANPEFTTEHLEAVVLTGRQYVEEKRQREPDLNFYEWNYAGHVRTVFRVGDQSYFIDRGFVVFRNFGVTNGDPARSWADLSPIVGGVEPNYYSQEALETVDSQVSRKLTQDAIDRSNRDNQEGEPLGKDDPLRFRRNPSLEDDVFEEKDERPLLLISADPQLLTNGSFEREACVLLCKSLLSRSGTQWERAGAVCIEFLRLPSGEIEALATYVADGGSSGGGGQMIRRRSSSAERIESDPASWRILEGAEIDHVEDGENVDRALWLSDAHSLRRRLGEFENVASLLSEESSADVDGRINASLHHLMVEYSLSSTDQIPSGRFLKIQGTDEYYMKPNFLADVLYTSRETMRESSTLRYKAHLRCMHGGRTFYRALAASFARVPQTSQDWNPQDRAKMTEERGRLQALYPGVEIQTVFIETSPPGEADRFDIDSAEFNEGLSRSIAVRSAQELLSRTDLSSQERSQLIELYVSPMPTVEQTLERMLKLFPSETLESGVSARDLLIENIKERLSGASDQKALLRDLFVRLTEDQLITEKSVRNLSETFGMRMILPIGGDVRFPDGYGMEIHQWNGLMEFIPKNEQGIADNATIRISTGENVASANHRFEMNARELFDAQQKGNLTLTVIDPSGKTLLENMSFAFDEKQIAGAGTEGAARTGPHEISILGTDLTLKEGTEFGGGRYRSFSQFTGGYDYARLLHLQQGERGMLTLRYADYLRPNPPLDALDAEIALLPAVEKGQLESLSVRLRSAFDAPQIDQAEMTDVLDRMESSVPVNSKVWLLLSEVREEAAGVKLHATLRRALIAPEQTEHAPGSERFERSVRRMCDLYLWQSNPIDREGALRTVLSAYHALPERREELLTTLFDELATSSEAEMTQRKSRAAEKGTTLRGNERDVGIITQEEMNRIVEVITQKFGVNEAMLQSYETAALDAREASESSAWLAPAKAAETSHFVTIPHLESDFSLSDEPTADEASDYDVRFTRGHYVLMKPFVPSSLPGRESQDSNAEEFRFGIVNENGGEIRWMTLHSFDDLAGKSIGAEIANAAVTTPRSPDAPTSAHRESLNSMLRLCVADQGVSAEDLRSRLLGTERDDGLLSLYLASADKEAFLILLSQELRNRQGKLNDTVVNEVATAMRTHASHEKFVPVLSRERTSKTLALRDGYQVRMAYEQRNGQSGIGIMLKRDGGLPVEATLSLSRSLPLRRGMQSEVGVHGWLSEADFADYGMTLSVKKNDGSFLLDSMPLVIEGTETARESVRQERQRESIRNDAVDLLRMSGLMPDRARLEEIVKSFEEAVQAVTFLVVGDGERIAQAVAAVRAASGNRTDSSAASQAVVSLKELVTSVELQNEDERESLLGIIRLAEQAVLPASPYALREVARRLNGKLQNASFETPQARMEFVRALLSPGTGEAFIGNGDQKEGLIRVAGDPASIEIIFAAEVKRETDTIADRLAAQGGTPELMREQVVSLNERMELLARMNVRYERPGRPRVENENGPRQTSKSSRLTSQAVAETGYCLHFDALRARFGLRFAPFAEVPEPPESLSSLNFGMKPGHVVDVRYRDNDGGNPRTLSITAGGTTDNVTVSYSQEVANEMGVTVDRSEGARGTARISISVDASGGGSFTFSHQSNLLPVVPDGGPPENWRSSLLTRHETMRSSDFRELDFATEKKNEWVGSGGEEFYLCHEDPSGSLCFYKWNGTQVSRLRKDTMSWESAPTDERHELPEVPRANE